MLLTITIQALLCFLCISPQVKKNSDLKCPYILMKLCGSLREAKEPNLIEIAVSSKLEKATGTWLLL